MAEAEGKMLANAAYHAAVVSGLAMGYAQLEKKFMKGATPKLDFTAYDIGMVIINVGLAMASKDLLVKQGIIPANILK